MIIFRRKLSIRLILVTALLIIFQFTQAFGAQEDLRNTFLFKKIDELQVAKQLEAIKSKFSLAKAEQDEHQKMLAKLKLEQTEQYRSKVAELLAEDIEKPLPEPSPILAKMEARISALKNEQLRLKEDLELLNADLSSQLNDINTHEEKLAAKLAMQAEAQTKFHETVELRAKLLVAQGTITDPEIINFIDKTTETFGSMQVLISLTKHKLKDYVEKNSEVKFGKRGKFKQLPQVRSFILWDDEKQDFYDLDKLTLKNLSLPSFKPFSVSISLENNVSIEELVVTNDELISGPNWPSMTHSDYGKCLSHKSFLEDQNPQSFCEQLFGSDAFIDVSFDNLRSGEGYVMSAASAREVQKLIEEFLNDAKIVLSDQYPSSFIVPFRNYLDDELQAVTNQKSEIKKQADTITARLQELFTISVELQEKQNRANESLLKIEYDLADLTTKADGLRSDLLREEELVKNHNKEKKAAQLAKVSSTQNIIDNIEAEIESNYRTESNVIDDTVFSLQNDMDKLLIRRQSLGGELVRLKNQLPDFFAQKHIEENLTTKVLFKPQPYTPSALQSCFGLKLTGNYFLSEPAQIRLLFKGEIVPEAVSRKYLDTRSIYASFTNKYNEQVRGVAPNLSGYTNAFVCEEFVYKKHSSTVARFFETAGGGSWNENNWSLQLVGAQLGIEDDLTKEMFYNVQNPIRHEIIFKSKIRDLEIEAESTFENLVKFQNELINFENNADVKIIQSWLRRKGFAQVVADGKWGSQSNAALVEYADNNNLKYGSPEDWTLELQRHLFALPDSF